MPRFKVLRALDAHGKFIGFLRRGRIIPGIEGATTHSGPSEVKRAIERASRRFPECSFELGDWLTGNRLKTEAGAEPTRMQELYARLAAALEAPTGTDDAKLLEQAVELLEARKLWQSN